MPALLKGSTASSWLSVAVAGGMMHVTEKFSGVTYSFDPVMKNWRGPFDLRPDESVCYCVTGTLAERKLWEVRGGLGSGMEEVAEMPKEMVRRLMGGSELGSVEVTWIGDFVYVRNTSLAEEFVVCEFIDGVRSEWRSVTNAAVSHGRRMVVCGGDVCMEDLSENRTLCMKQV
uniref:F-box/kelch-repeat protein At1g23390 family n=2 Tax=Cajanus cajan TaxID=3821 RepID=A0A151TGH4_CAJCA|nr:F-box/kelch-repeat protein At1g23390 family [Cajanus cajan]